MPAPELTVIVPCFDALPELQMQLEALTRQQDAPAHEVLLCDNGSADGLPAWFAEHGHRYPAARLVPAGELQGAGYARNRGIAEARAPKLAFCDADDVVCRDWMRRAVLALEEHEVVTGGILSIPSSRFPADLDAVQDLLRGSGPERAPVPAGRGAVGVALMGGNFAVRRDVLRGIGGFDTARLGPGEDNDLAVRLEQAGHEIVDDGNLAIAYRVVPDSSRHKYREQFLNGLSSAEVCAVHGLWDSAPLMRPWPGLQLLRAVAAGAAMLAGRRPADVPALAERLLTSSGALLGHLRWRVLGRIPRQALGVGLEGPARG